MYCTMYKKVLYNSKKIKKCGGREGEGQYLNPKHSVFKRKKKNKKKNVTEPGLEPTTSGLEKPALLSTRLNTMIGITKYEGENYNIQTAIIKKKIMSFFS